MDASIKNLYQHVAFLTGLQPARNYRNLASLNKAAGYLHEQFSALEFKTVEYQPFTVKGGDTYKNISARIQGKSNERIVVGAHYDVWGELPGADDNASAVAGLLETARLLSIFSKEHTPAYTLEFVAYCLEEPPFFATAEMGSAVHARQLYQNKTPLRLMVCYEMIGYFSDEAGSQGFPHPSLKELYPDKGNFIIVGGHSTQAEVARDFAALMQKGCNIPVYPVASPLTDGPVALSDHRSYWQYQYPAVMINDTSFLRNPNYHELTDTIDTLNFEKMAEVVNGVVGALLSMNR